MNLRFFLALGVLLVAGSLLAGCVATTGDVRGAYARQAKLEERMDRLSEEVKELRAQLEGARGGELSDAEAAGVNERLRRLEQQLNTLWARLYRLESGREMPGELPPETAPPFARFPSGRPSTTPPPVQGEAPLGEEAAALLGEGSFGVAYRELGHGNYKEARSLFKEFIESNEDSPLLADAHYWIAESYYREGRYEESILEFQSFIDRFPKDQRVPRAYLKQGLSLINIDRPEEAKLFLQTIVDKYPRSEEASIAKEKMRELAMEERKY